MSVATFDLAAIDMLLPADVVPHLDTDAVIDKKTNLFDWNLLPGCFVRRSNKLSDDQIGFCKETNVTLTLKSHDNEVFEDVERSRFVPLTTVAFGTLILCRNWIGKVLKVKYSITLNCEDGSVAVVHFDDICDFVDTQKEKSACFCFYSSINNYCVGKQLVGRKKRLRNSRWLQLSDEMKKYLDSEGDDSEAKVTVVDVAMSEIKVHWLYCISDDTTVSIAQSSSSKSIDTASDEEKNNLYRVIEGVASNGLKAPLKTLKANDLFDVKSLNYIANSLKSKIGENGYYLKDPESSGDNYPKETLQNITSDCVAESSKSESCSETTESGSESAESGSVISQNDVLDDVISNATNGVDFFAITTWVVDDNSPPFKRKQSSQKCETKSKKRKPAKESFSLSNHGTPVEIVASKMLVTIVWQNGEVETNVPPSSLLPFDYFLENDDIFPGKFVVKIDNKKDEYGVVQNVCYSARTANVNWYKKSETSPEGYVPQFIKSELVSTYDIKKDPRLGYYRGAYVFKITKNGASDITSRVGQVVNPWCDGQVLCGWANGTQSYVYPQELLILSRINTTETSKHATLPISKPSSSKSTVFKFMKDSSESLKMMLEKMKTNKLPSSSKFVKFMEDMLSKNPKSGEESGEFAEAEENDATFELTVDDKVREAGELKTLETVPDNHRYKHVTFQLNNPTNFAKRVKKEILILQSSLPPSISVKTFEDRIDLFSVMIKGPKSTPYEDGVFLFDIQLPSNYPHTPPLVHHYSYCSKRMNPNLYEDGLVCLSLIGTWTGSGTEMWTAKSNLLQLLVSIQGLILVDEPYFNEPAFVRQKGTDIGFQKSKLYNEMVVIKLVQSMSKLVENPLQIFLEEIREHFKQTAKSFIQRIEEWIYLSSDSPASDEGSDHAYMRRCGKPPDFPLLPCSQGFCISLRREISKFKETLRSHDIQFE